MRQIGKDELKHILLELLITIDKYCKENGIQYFLDSGTLLGAIRHKGFIPWDDDIDICMTRPNYDLFLETIKKKKIAEHIDVVLPEDSLFTYFKICDNRTLLIEYPETYRLKIGVYVDVFPKDGHPKGECLSKFHCTIGKVLCNWYWFNKYSIPVWKKQRNVIKKMISYVASPLFFNSEFPLKLAKKLAVKYKYDTSEYTSSILAGGIRGRVPKECFETAIDAEFEGHKFPIPVGYDQYLRKLYENINHGDYMQLPKETQRLQHDTEVYWK